MFLYSIQVDWLTLCVVYFSVKIAPLSKFNAIYAKLICAKNTQIPFDTLPEPIFAILKIFTHTRGMFVVYVHLVGLVFHFD